VTAKQADAWILDVTHRMRRLSCEVPPGTRPLHAMREEAWRALSLELGVPIGLSTLDTTPELLFVLPRAGEGDGWTPLSSWAPADERGFRLYVQAMLGGWEPPTRTLDVFHFGNDAQLAAKLAHLVVKGVKRGTTGWVEAAAAEGSPIPTVGTVSIVTDGFGYAQCAIVTDKIERLRFRDVDATHAWVEGEGDRTLEDWREGHLRYFHEEARQLAIPFTEDSLVFFEHFRVLAVFGRADA